MVDLDLAHAVRGANVAVVPAVARRINRFGGVGSETAVSGVDIACDGSSVKGDVGIAVAMRVSTAGVVGWFKLAGVLIGMT